MIDPKANKQQKKKNAQRRAKQLKKAKQKAMKSFASSPVGSAVNQCQNPIQMSALAAEVVLAEKPTSISRKNCSLINTEAFCEHKKRKAQSNLLKVVPTRAFGNPTKGKSLGIGDRFGFEASVTKGSSEKGDKLTLQAKMYQNCGSHPIWKVKDDKNSIVKQQTGENLAFEVLPPEIDEWWYKNIQPRKYFIECLDHNGSVISNEINVYPLIEASLLIKLGSSVDEEAEKKFEGQVSDKLKKFGDRLEKIKLIRKLLESAPEVIKKIVPNIKDFSVKVLRGTISLKNSWVEDEATNLANWEAEISVNIEPLISISGKCQISPTVVPPIISKYVDAYIYLGLQGDISINTAIKWKAGNYNQRNAAINGSITGSIGATAFVGKKYKVISLDINGGTKLIANCKLILTVEPKAELEGKLLWEPLKVKITIEALDGWISLVPGKEWTFFEQQELFSGSHQFFSN